MFHTLRSKLLLFFLSLSLGSILLVSLTIQFGFEDSFQDYLYQKRSVQIEQMMDVLKDEYDQTGAIKGEAISMLLHQQAMSENLFYQFYDVEQNLIFDSTFMAGMIHGNRMGNQLNEEDWLTSSYSVEGKGKMLGTLKVIFPRGYIQGEFQFLNQFKKYILLAGIAMTFLSVIFGLLFSKRLTSGFLQLKQATRELKNHNLSIRIPVNHMDQEIADLAMAFNELAETLNHEGKLRKQYIGDLAHELRTPLSTLRSQVEAFQDEIWEPTAERLQQCHDELMRLVRLVKEFEQLAAAENPQIQLKSEPVEAGKLMHLLIDRFQPSYNDKGVDLFFELSDSELWFEGDMDRVQQIFTNILDNALKYTPSGGKVRLEVKKDRKNIHFLITDTGKGISQDDLPHVFERFYRGEKSRDRKTGGVGIGLSIVKALVQAHKGEIQIQSEPEKGTRVKVSLPIARL